MRRHRNAKIIATLGPASSSPEIVRSLFDAGADVFRLNFSHGTHEDHKKRYDHHPLHREGRWTADRSSRGPAGAEAAARHVRSRPRDPDHRREVWARSGWRTRRQGTGQLAPSGDLPGTRSRGAAAARRRQGPVGGGVLQFGSSNDSGSRRRRCCPIAKGSASSAPSCRSPL